MTGRLQIGTTIVEDKSKTPRSKTAGRPLESVLDLSSAVSAGKGSAAKRRAV